MAGAVGPLELRTRSPEETRAVGAAIAEVLLPGDVVSLTGDLGAGKTCLVQGAAEALGASEPVTSPTFVLAREYRGRMPIHHLDIYRLDRIQEVLDLGLEDLLEGAAVAFIEWGDAIDALLPEAHLRVELTLLGDTDERNLRLVGRGVPWVRRWERLEGVLGRWKAA